MRLIAAFVTLLLAPLPAHPRDVSGTIAYTMRIALPPDTQMAVELSTPSGPVASFRQPTRGAQVPLPFRLADDTGAPLTLRAAIFIDGRPLWTSQPYPVAAGTDDVDIGTVRLDPFIALGFAAQFACGDQRVAIGFLDQPPLPTARLRAGGTTHVLTQAPATRGRRFTDGATPETALRSQSGRIRVTLAGRTLPDCTPLIPANLLPFRASGTEPVWSLTATPDGLMLQTPDAPTLTAPLPPAQTSATGITFQTDTLSVTLQDTLCHNAMTGMPFPVTVTVNTADSTLSGCGGDPAALLDGTWQAQELGKTPLRGGAKVVFTFQSGSLAGTACNRFSGQLTLTGEGLSFAPMATTRMACPAPQMQAETAALAAFAATTRFDIDQSGRLVLIGPSGPLLVATR